VLEGLLSDLGQLIELCLLGFYPFFTRNFLPLQEFDPVLEHFNLIISLLSHLALFEHFDAFFDQIAFIIEAGLLLVATDVAHGGMAAR